MQRCVSTVRTVERHLKFGSDRNHRYPTTLNINGMNGMAQQSESSARAQRSSRESCCMSVFRIDTAKEDV